MNEADKTAQPHMDDHPDGEDTARRSRRGFVKIVSFFGAALLAGGVVLAATGGAVADSSWFIGAHIAIALGLYIALRIHRERMEALRHQEAMDGLNLIEREAKEIAGSAPSDDAP